MITTKTVTVCTCDRCGAVRDEEKEFADGVSGEMKLKYSGHTGGRSWQGDWGGTNHNGEAWLCQSCAREFLDFMRGNKK